MKYTKVTFWYQFVLLISVILAVLVFSSKNVLLLSLWEMLASCCVSLMLEIPALGRLKQSRVPWIPEVVASASFQLLVCFKDLELLHTWLYFSPRSHTLSSSHHCNMGDFDFKNTKFLLGSIKGFQKVRLKYLRIMIFLSFFFQFEQKSDAVFDEIVENCKYYLRKKSGYS